MEELCATKRAATAKSVILGWTKVISASRRSCNVTGPRVSGRSVVTLRWMTASRNGHWTKDVWRG